jgi:hypothetical protein
LIRENARLTRDPKYWALYDEKADEIVAPAFAKADQIISSLQDRWRPPEGWKLVPVEPTAVQIVATAVQAGDASHADYELAKEAAALLPPMGPLEPGALEVPDILAEIVRDYRSMLKAAPIPSSLKGSDVGEVGE